MLGVHEAVRIFETVSRTALAAGENTANNRRLQRFTLTCGREERFSIAVLLLPRASIVHDNK